MVGDLGTNFNKMKDFISTIRDRKTHRFYDKRDGVWDNGIKSILVTHISPKAIIDGIPPCILIFRA